MRFRDHKSTARCIARKGKGYLQCNQCGKEFPFKRGHDLHMNTHRTMKSFKCAKPNCNKSYYSQGELDKHAKTHSKKIWKCSQCAYKNKDEHNLNAHMPDTVDSKGIFARTVWNSSGTIHSCGDTSHVLQNLPRIRTVRSSQNQVKVLITDLLY